VNPLGASVLVSFRQPLFDVRTNESEDETYDCQYDPDSALDHDERQQPTHDSNGSEHRELAHAGDRIGCPIPKRPWEKTVKMLSYRTSRTARWISGKIARKENFKTG
jgi:hypothetical protein